MPGRDFAEALRAAIAGPGELLRDPTREALCEAERRLRAELVTDTLNLYTRALVGLLPPGVSVAWEGAEPPAAGFDGITRAFGAGEAGAEAPSVVVMHTRGGRPARRLRRKLLRALRRKARE